MKVRIGATEAEYKYMSSFGYRANGKIHPAVVGFTLEVGPEAITVELNPHETASLINHLAQHLAEALRE